MPRTILEIAQEAAERDATAPKPTTLFGNENKIARILRTAAKDTIRDFLRRSRYFGLSDHHSTWVFALQSGRYAYELPPDFLRIIPGTEQRGSWPLGLIGPATPQAWAAWLYGGAANVAPHGWRIKNGVLWIDPTPTAEELVVIEYVSRYPVVSAIREGDINLSSEPLQMNAPVVSRDGWIKLADDNLVQDTRANRFKYDAEPGWDEAFWAMTPEEVLKRLNPTSSEEPIPQVRREAFTADTDTPAWDDDYLLSLGMTFRLRRGLAMPYQEQADEYEAEIENKIGEDAGGARSFTIGGGDCGAETWPLEAGNENGNSWVVS
ncbi:hypothetical protein [Pseudooceanicola atlanticus]|uniref:phage adaptor protein n=1 Tax=Pseudooceanicola atlanticus TaxID=1461694 RepID=UPI002356C85B|nr:hypothetical protein [Pseudooceanicola atlanticus]